MLKHQWPSQCKLESSQLQISTNMLTTHIIATYHRPQVKVYPPEFHYRDIVFKTDNAFMNISVEMFGCGITES